MLDSPMPFTKLELYTDSKLEKLLELKLIGVVTKDLTNKMPNRTKVLIG